jgi:hypothetical protein
MAGALFLALGKPKANDHSIAEPAALRLHPSVPRPGKEQQ